MRRFAYIIPLFLISIILFSYMPNVSAQVTWYMNTASAGVDGTALRRLTFSSTYDPQVLYFNNTYYFAYTGQGNTGYVWVFDKDMQYLGRYDISPGWRVADICVFQAGGYVYAAVGRYLYSTWAVGQVVIYRLINGSVIWVRTVDVGESSQQESREMITRVYPVLGETGSTRYLIAANFGGTNGYGIRVVLIDANNGFNSNQIYSVSGINPGFNAKLWGYYSNGILYWSDGRYLFKYTIGGTNAQLYDRTWHPIGQTLAHVVYYGGDSNFIFRFYMQDNNYLMMFQHRMNDGVLTTVSRTLRGDVKNILNYQWNNPQSSYLDTIILQTNDNLMVSQSITFDSLYNYANTSSTTLTEMTIPLTNFNPLRIAFTSNGKLFYYGLYSSQSQVLIQQTEGGSAPPVPPEGGSGAIATINASSNRKLLFYRELDNNYNIKYITVQISANESGTLYTYTGSSGANMTLFGSKTFSPGNKTLTIHGDANGKMVAVLFKFNNDYQLNYSCATYSSSVMYYDNDIESYLSINLNNFADLTNVGNPLVGVSIFIPPTDNRTGYVGDPRGGGAGGQYFNYTLWFIVNNMSQPNQLDINRNNTIPQALQNVKQVVEDYGLPWGLFGLIVFAGCCFATAFSLSKHNAADPRLILFFVTVIGYVLFAAGVVDFVVPALCTIALIGVSAMAVARQFGGGGGE
jgi:uncharacterized protein (DUF1330 family)